MAIKEELPTLIIEIVGGRMEELEKEIESLKNKLNILEKEHFIIETWLNKNGVNTSIL